MAEPATTPPEAAPAPTVQPTKRSAVPALSLVVSILALGAALSQPYWLPYVQPPAPATAAPAPDTSGLDALTGKVQRLSDEMATFKLSNATQPPAATTAELAALHDRLNMLEAGLKEAAGTSANLKALSTSIDELKTKQAKAETADVASKTLLVATLQLVTAWQNGSPFGAPWTSALAAAEADDDALATKLNDSAPVLLPWRDRGLPTLTRLTTDFPVAARVAVAASAPKPEGWVDQTLATAKSLVSVRRVGSDVAGESAEAVLARAEAVLASGNLSDAVAKLEGLPDASRDAMKEWLTAARARLKADSLSAELTAHTADNLLPAAGSP